MEIKDEEIKLFAEAIRQHSLYDFSDYSEKSFRRRIEKLVSDNHCDIPKLIEKMAKDEVFLEKIVKDITVNTTELFRDPKMWHQLRYQVLPLFSNKEKIRLWHAGCSTGEELYSMLILLNEMGLFDKTEVVGTDLNEDVLKIAKNGQYRYKFNMVYLENFDKVIIENPNNQEKYEVNYDKYFTIDKTRDTIKMHQFLLEKPVFQAHDLVSGKHEFSEPFDLIICRNVLIYFNNNLQNKVFDLFYKALVPNGQLVIGVHESILGPLANKFSKMAQIYQKK